MSDLYSKCDDCGKFMSPCREATWADIYDFLDMGLEYQHWRCRHCTNRLGPVTSNARPHNGDMSPYQGNLKP